MRGGATTILKRQTLSAFTSVYVKQISSYSANGCETKGNQHKVRPFKFVLTTGHKVADFSGTSHSEKKQQLDGEVHLATHAKAHVEMNNLPRKEHLHISPLDFDR